jgi:flagellin
MRISHNIAAMNTYRQYNTNSVNTNKSMEKLSSGYRINRAADDAAGLSISEKMRSQIRGLTQGTRNAQDGVSFLQTAEGALNEVSDMLVRLKELAVQVQNGTYSDDDKTNIGSEMNALGTAIGEIYLNTKFNGIAVFGAQGDGGTPEVFDTAGQDGTVAAAAVKYGEDGNQTVTINTAKSQSLGALIGLTNAAVDATTTALVTTAAVELAITEVNTVRGGYGA